MPLRRSIVFAVAILVAGSNAAAQDLIVSRNVNLRPDPSTAQPALRLMLPGSELFLVWSQSNTAFGDPQDGLISSLGENLFSQKAHNIFLVKLTYRFLL